MAGKTTTTRPREKREIILQSGYARIQSHQKPFVQHSFCKSSMGLLEASLAEGRPIRAVYLKRRVIEVFLQVRTAKRHK